RNIFNANLTGDGEPERVLGALVTASLFKTLRVQPAFGRGFLEEEEQVGGNSDVLILSDDLWRRRYGADKNIVGKTVELNGQPFTVVGIMGPEFRYPGREFQLWRPLVVNPDDYRTRMNYGYIAVARLKPGADLEQARSEMDTISRRLAQQYPDTNEGVGAVVAPMLEDTVAGVSRPLFVLFAAVLCLLLIGCANLTNLLVARAIARSQELQVRAALGAGTVRLMAQSVVETFPIILIGGILGVLSAAWTVDSLIPFLPSTMPRVEEIRISLPVLAFTFLTLVLTAVIAGILRALQVKCSNLASSLHDSFRGTSLGRGRSRMRDLIVVLQIAVALMLLIGAGLLMRSYTELRSVDPGFDSNGVLSLHLAIPRSKYPRDTQVASFCQGILRRVGELPDVVSAGMVNRLPLGGVAQIGAIEGERPDATTTPSTPVDWRTVTPDYFKALGIPLKKGRTFTEQDRGQWFDNDRPETPLVGIVDDRIAELFWPNEDPIGKRFRIGEGLPWTEVIGVAGHIRNDRVDQDARPQVYWNYQQRAQDRMVLVVRTRRAPESIAASVIREIREADPDQPVYDVRTMTEVVDRSVSQQWLNTVLLGVFAAASLILTGIGIYGVISYSVGQRVREFGIRMALGADRRDLVRFVLRHAAVLTLSGAALGLAAAWLLTGVLSGLLFNVSSTDTLTYVFSAVALVSIGLVASYIPSRRASRVDPMIAIRS
ncbi:MAG: ABC transporter permease, partial [Acidobacteria bacterium]|nr:ABC transporter permease [Acidobacteriota bacterium]